MVWTQVLGYLFRKQSSIVERPPADTPENAVIYDNADTSLGPECHLHRLTYKNADTSLFCKVDTWLGPNGIPPIQTHPYSGHFGTNFVDSHKQHEELEAIVPKHARTTNLTVSNCHVSHSWGHRVYYIIGLANSHTHTIVMTPKIGHLANRATFDWCQWNLIHCIKVSRNSRDPSEDLAWLGTT